RPLLGEIIGPLQPPPFLGGTVTGLFQEQRDPGCHVAALIDETGNRCPQDADALGKSPLRESAGNDVHVFQYPPWMLLHKAPDGCACESWRGLYTVNLQCTNPFWRGRVEAAT